MTKLSMGSINHAVTKGRVISKPKQKEPPTMSTSLAEQQVTLKQLSNIARIFKASKGEIRPHCTLTGPSGSGKSHLASLLAEMHNLVYIEINAAQLTKEGTSGNSLSKALAPISKHNGVPVLCFVDEFDKLFISGDGNSSSAHEVTTGVQNEFLRVLESDTTSVFGDYGKYNECSLKNVLFMFAGAFNGELDIDLDRLRAFGIKTEFLGRVSLVYNLPKLSLESMLLALEESPLLKKYLDLFDGIEKDVVIEALTPYVKEAYDTNTLGIRLINTLLHQYFINDGKLAKEVKKTTFQNKLKMGD